jgi:hypothetical protein
MKPCIKKNYITKCPQLDDHLGIAVILEWLKGVGKFDVLLTDDEEVGQSTASYFDPPRQYRYMIEFDRNGSDCVFYQYNEILEYTFLEAGWEVGRGSFSDISFLGHIGCEGVNVGIGYHREHSENCYCNLSEVNTQLMKFAVWYKYFGKDSYPFEEKPRLPYNPDDDDWFPHYSLQSVT